MTRVELADINLNLLVALDALLSERGVSGAARRAHVTPSAMSHALAELRDLFGDALLVRAGRGMALTPRAQALVMPLHRLLLDAQALVRDDSGFEPRTAERRFVIAAPDFLSVLILPALTAAVTREAPGVSLDVVPSARRGNAWLLETGEIDLALGAVVEEAPGIRHADLCTEGFACAVRRGHPSIDGTLTLEAYVAAPHLVITLGDDERPTWIDEALAARGLERRVAVRVRHFMAAPLVVSRTDLVMTGPSMLLRYFAELVPLQVLKPPIALPTYPEEAYWHERFDADPAHRWLRELVRTTMKPLGIGGRPERRSWIEQRSTAVEKRSAPKRKRRR
ncbi:MAG TPA: LysR family transcriptional regulator [Polyangiaceae bacterium]|nr:LysR family transcriptional regulator [Polyangiaceae bacterium]